MHKPKRSRVRHRPPPKRQLAIGIVGLAVLLSAFLAGIAQRTMTFEPVPSVRAQQHIHSSHPLGQMFEPLLDGSEQPELIPDDVAIRALMQTLRVPHNPDTAALEQLRAQVHRVNLSNADFQVLVSELGTFDARAKEQQARVETARPSSAAASGAAIARYVEERKRFESLIVDQYHLLLASLSPDGAARLQNHLLHVKSRIKIYPTPDMSASID